MSDTPGSGEPGTPDNGGQPAPTPTPAPWHAAFEGDDKGWIENRGLHLKSADEAIAAAIQTARHAEKKLGVPNERILTLPADRTVPGSMDDIYSKLGRPAEPKDYELGTNGEDPITDQFAETLAGVLHTNGISKDAGSAIFKAIGDYVTKAADEKETADAAENTAAWDDLKSRWGEDFDVNSVLAKEVVKQLGVDKETVDALEAALGQSAKVVEFFAHLGSKTRTELPFIGSANSGGNPVLTPEAAKQELDQLRADPSWAKRFLDGDVGVRRQFESLSRIAAKAM